MEKEKDNKADIQEKKEDSAKPGTRENQSSGSIKKVTYIVLLISVLFFIWYVAADRHTPYTDQGRIQGLITIAITSSASS